MKKLSLCILTSVLLSCGAANAQYRIYYDKPVLNGHYLSVGIVDMDLKSLATWNLRYETFLADGKFSLNMEYANITNLKMLRNYVRNNYPEVASDFDSVGIIPIRSDKLTPKKFEIGGTYNFHQRQKRAVRPISLYSYSAGYNTTVHVYTMRQITLYRFTGIRAGLGMMRTLYFGEASSDDLYDYNVVATPSPPPGETFLYATRYNQTYMYLGISRNSIFNVKVSDLPGAGVRNGFTTGYFDLLILASSSIDDVRDYKNLQTYQLSTVDRKKLNRIGYRLGVRSQAVRYFGLGTVMEIGKFTGGTLLPAEVTDYWEESVGIIKYINYMRIGLYLSLTGPIAQQNISNKW